MLALSLILFLVGVLAIALFSSGTSSWLGWVIGLVFVGAAFGLPIWESRQRAERARKRKEEILSHVGEWGEEICQAVVNRKVEIDMNKDMVRLAWGQPTTVDNKEETAKATKERWVYGVARAGRPASYVWFTNGKVAKTKE